MTANLLVLNPLWAQDDKNTASTSIEQPVLKQSIKDQAVEKARMGDFASALLLIDEAYAATPDDQQLVLDHIVVLSWSGQDREAIEEYLAVKDKTKVPDYVLLEVARSYRMTRNYETAIASYQDYLSRNPAEKKAIEGLLNTYLESGKTEEAEKFIQEALSRKVSGEPSSKVFLGDVLLSKGKKDKAEEIYREALETDPNDLHAKLGLAKILLAQDRIEAALVLVNDVLARDPKNFEGLIAKGEVLEKSGDYLEAHAHYEKTLETYQGSPVVSGLKYRSLMELGANSLAKELVSRGQVVIDPVILNNLAGDEVMTRIRWNEPDKAAELLRQRETEKPASGETAPQISLRDIYDRIACARDLQDMQEVLRLYAELKERHAVVPVWTLTQVADAELYLRHPEKALAYYQEALAQSWDPDSTTSLAVYYTLIELGRYRDADKFLAKIEKAVPDQALLKGVLRDNTVKEEIVTNGAWSLLYQDRLREGNRSLDQLSSKAPMNAGFRTTLGQAYLWRGWPRKALEELRISNTIDPEDVRTRTVLAYAWDENDQGEVARELAKKLVLGYPSNVKVQQLARYFKVLDMRTLTVSASYGVDKPGAHDFNWSVRVDQPIKPWRSIFGAYLWHRSRADGTTGLTKRFLAGTDWRLGRDWWPTIGFSIDENGSDAGHFENLAWKPDDHWTLAAAYDSYSTDLPPRAAAQGVQAKDSTFSLRYRSSELFTAEGYLRLRDFNDGNSQTAEGIRLDRALTTAAYWKTRLALEGYHEENVDTDVFYFSPDNFYSLYAVPMIEHIWFRRYERSWTDRGFLGLGRQWQDGYGWDNDWYARYEQEHVLSDRLNILWGANVSQKYYDGTSTDGWSVDVRLKYNF